MFMFQNEASDWFQAQWLNRSFPSCDISQLCFWPIFLPISQQLCLLHISLSVSISEFNEQTDVLKGSFTKDATYELLAVCLQPLSYYVLEVENLWSSSWRISISVLFFWSIFLPQRHGTLMYLKSHYYGITQLLRVISSALRCVRRGDKVWNPRRACAEWIEKRRQEEGEIQRSEGFRLNALLWRILCPGCWVYHV